jgi:hypothetical protein
MAVLVVTLVIVFSPLLPVLHFILRKLGRQGFVQHGDDGSLTLQVSAAGFRKNNSQQEAKA